jgi:hypothetical protein
MQIKKASTIKTIFPSFIANSRIMQAIMLLVIVVGSIMIGSLLVDKSYIVYYWQKAKNLVVQEAGDIVNTETYVQKDNGLDTLVLDIPFESMEKIKTKRDEAINTGILLSTDDDLVNAKATFNNQNTIKIDMRLKGDWVDHIESEKWSFRIHTKGDGQILGMTNFSIQSPDTRQFLYEWAYHQHLIKENILTTRYSFLNVVENGEYKGVYAIEDSFTTELMESQESRAGVIIRFDEDSLWINRANFIEDSDETYTLASAQGLFMVTEMDQAAISIFQSNSVTSDPVLNEEAKTAIDLLSGFQHGTLSASQVFDVEKFGRFLAITDFWAANHATFWHNLRFYYNPITSMLEPIAYDGDTGRYPSSDLARIFGDETYFKNAEIRKSYASELQRITTEEYLVNLEESLNTEITPFYNALVEEYGDQIVIPWEFLESRRIVLYDQIHPPFPVQGDYVLSIANENAELQARIQNLMILPVEILGMEIIVNNETYIFDVNSMHIEGDLIDQENEYEINFIGFDDNNPRPEVTATVRLDDELFSLLTSGETYEILAKVKLSGIDGIYSIPLTLDPGAQDIENRPEMLFTKAIDDWSKHEFLSQLDEDTLVVKEGDWLVDGDLVIPQQFDLIIMPGTILRFQENAIFLVGRKILSKGTEAKPVYLKAATQNWSGLVVLSADEKSYMNYTIIEDTASINRDSWILTGGVTFYESPVRIFYSSFLNHIGEDALNIIHSDYELVYVKMENSFADALDTDFSDGLIQNCGFSNIGGDAVDVSGSTAKIIDSNMINITDKGVSAGENSTVSITNLSIDTANIGVASKDLSSVTVDEIYLHQIHLAGFAAYIKKPVYGPSSIVAKYVYQDNVANPALVQIGNSVRLDEMDMETQTLDVDTLYKLGILGN